MAGCQRDEPVAVAVEERVGADEKRVGVLTGFSPFLMELMPKRLELLSELVPQARVIAFLVNPNFPTIEGFKDPIRDVQEAARTKGI